MFYIRKPTREKISLLREATTVELHNYKNRFILQPPSSEPEQETDINCNCGCNAGFAGMQFININCDLELNDFATES